VRLNSDGSSDEEFKAETDSLSDITSVIPQADGKILVFGYTTTNAEVINDTKDFTGDIDPEAGVKKTTRQPA
jgi:hypothetical protein